MDLALIRPVSRTFWTGARVAVASACLWLLGTVAYLLQAGHATPRIFVVSIPMGLLAAAFLWADAFPDSSKAEPNIITHLGRERASQILEAAVAAVFLLLGLLPWLGLPQGVWFGVAALPFAAGAARKLADHPESMDVVAPARQMLRESTVVFAVAVSAGLLLSSL